MVLFVLFALFEKRASSETIGFSCSSLLLAFSRVLRRSQLKGNMHFTDQGVQLEVTQLVLNSASCYCLQLLEMLAVHGLSTEHAKDWSGKVDPLKCLLWIILLL